MGYQCIISMEETRERKMVCVSFHWEQKNRINYGLFPTPCLPQTCMESEQKEVALMFVSEEAEELGVEILPQRALKKTVKSQMVSPFQTQL